MTDAKITCPNCSTEIPLTESLAGPLLAAERAASAQALEAERAKAAKALEGEAARLKEEARATAAAEMQAQAAKQAAETKAALAARDRELAELKADAEVNAAALEASHKAQAEALKKERALKEREAALEVETEKRVAALLKESEAVQKARLAEAEAAKSQALREEFEQKLEEARQQNEIMRRQVDEMKRKAEQGSMQVQGEAAEVLLEDRLSRTFPMDTISEVGKGARGADCLQSVTTSAGVAGRIIWEVKETQAYSPAWLPKLREDMRAANADVAVLVSRVRPDGVDSFAMVDGVWVAAPQAAIPLAHVLRVSLIDLATARGAREGQATKTEMLYDYFTGPQFRARLEAVAEPFVAMQATLMQEKRAMQKHWAARERQMEKVIGAISGLQGDVEGITGQTIAELDAMTPALLEDEE